MDDTIVGRNIADALEANLKRVTAERDALAAELDTERHEWEMFAADAPKMIVKASGETGCGFRISERHWCGLEPDDPAHRTSRVVLAEHAEGQ